VTAVRGHRHTLRTRLLWTVVLTVAAALALTTLGFNFLLWQGLSHNADSLARARAADEAGSLEVVSGRVVSSEVPDRWGLESEAWTFVDGRKTDGPVVTHALDVAAQRVAGTPSRIVDVPAQHVRLYARPVEFGGKQVATIVAGVSMTPYEKTARLALLGSLALAGALLVVVFFVTRWVLGAALRPVARMTADAETWSLEGADRRFAAGEPRDEIGRLAATLDGLLDRVSASLRREQRFSAELSHELRTPLAKVRAEAELALRRERAPETYRAALRSVLDNSQTMTRIIDTLVTAQRQESGLARGSADPQAVLDDAVAANTALAEERGLALTAAGGPGASGGAGAAGGTGVSRPPGRLAAHVGVEAEVVLRILQPVIENACRYAATAVMLGAERRDGEIRFTVDDDGPGVAAGELERVFEPGVRGGAGEHDEFPGAGLGLALARRLARAASGDVEAAAGPGGHFVVRLPVG